MDEPLPPDPTTGPYEPAPGEPMPADGNDTKRWIPAIVLGGVLLVLIVLFAVNALGGDDDDPAETTTSTLVTTSTSTTAPSTTTTEATTTTSQVATTTATTAPATTTTAAATTTALDPASTELIAQCNQRDEFACYEVGRLGLPPPPTVTNPGSWDAASDDDVAQACQADLNLTACYVAGQRELVLGD